MYILDHYSLTVKIIDSKTQVKGGTLEIHDMVNGEAKRIKFSEISKTNWEIEDLTETTDNFQTLQNNPFFFHLETPNPEPYKLHIYCPNQDYYLEMTGFISIA